MHCPVKKPPFEPYFHDQPDSERWWKLANAVLWSWLILWWMFPHLIPIRFGRWLFVALGLMGCASMDEMRQHEEMHCSGWAHQVPTHQEGPTFYEWEKTRPESVKPWVYIYTHDPEAACRAIGAQAVGNRIIQACAIWKPSNCIIILPKE